MQHEKKCVPRSGLIEAKESVYELYLYLQGKALVRKDAQGPEIALPPVGPVLTYLRRQRVRGANLGSGDALRVVHNLIERSCTTMQRCRECMYIHGDRQSEVAYSFEVFLRHHAFQEAKTGT